MKKSTLIAIADIVNNIDNSNRELYEMINLLNVTPEEMNKIVDAIMVTAEKISQLKRANLKELDRYIDVKYVENTNRY
jgi:hypothetical protein